MFQIAGSTTSITGPVLQPREKPKSPVHRRGQPLPSSAAGSADRPCTAPAGSAPRRPPSHRDLTKSAGRAGSPGISPISANVANESASSVVIAPASRTTRNRITPAHQRVVTSHCSPTAADHPQAPALRPGRRRSGARSVDGNAQPGGGASGAGCFRLATHGRAAACRWPIRAAPRPATPRCKDAPGAANNAAPRSHLDDAAQIHRRDPVGQMMHRPQIMRDQEQRPPRSARAGSVSKFRIWLWIDTSQRRTAARPPRSPAAPGASARAIAMRCRCPAAETDADKRFSASAGSPTIPQQLRAPAPVATPGRRLRWIFNGSEMMALIDSRGIQRAERVLEHQLHLATHGLTRFRRHRPPCPRRDTAHAPRPARAAPSMARARLGPCRSRSPPPAPASRPPAGSGTHRSPPAPPPRAGTARPRR